jgi:hypothetical protein
MKTVLAGVALAFALVLGGYAWPHETAPKLYGEGQKINDRVITLSELTPEQMAHKIMWGAVEAFGDPETPRKNLLARFRLIVKYFPRTHDAPQAREYAGLLKKMIAEDGAHARRPAKPIGNRTQKEQIAELIFRLRDQKGSQSGPGRCDIFTDPRGERSPAHRLVKIGHEAVPQLIRALEDERLTRSVQYGRSDAFTHEVLRVGDCALAILDKIAGRSFNAGALMIEHGQAAATKKKVQSWWRAFQKKGEKQILIEAVACGDEQCFEQAKRLLKKYPEAALNPLMEGARTTKNPWLRAWLVGLAAKYKGDPVLAFLRAELHGPTLGSRIAAARGLLDRNLDDGVKALVRQWRDLAAERERPDGTGELITILASCNRGAGVRALATDWRKRPIDERIYVLKALSEEGCQRGQGKRSVAVARAIDELLLAALDDMEERLAMSGSWDDKELTNPRVCDLASHLLSRGWKRPDLFDLSRTLKTRNRQRIELKNVWRKKQGQKPLPLPAARKISPVPAKKMRPLLEDIVKAPTPARRRYALKAVEALGLPALPAVREMLRNLKPTHPAYEGLDNLGRRLAFVVAEVSFGDRSVKPSKELQGLLASLRRKSLEARTLVKVLHTALVSLPAEATGIRLDIDREGDDTGVTIIAVLTTGKVRPPGTPKGWNCFESFKVAGMGYSYASRDSAYEDGLSGEIWQDFSRHVQSVLETEPGKEVSIRVGASLDP